MAERVKRRVAAARMAVAFVAAGTIAGASAWAQAGPPPPTAQSSAFDAFLKIDSIKGENVLDGSLLFEDFKKHEVPSYKQFQKLQTAQKHFQKVVFNRYYPKVEIDKSFIKGESTDFVKHSEFDGQYIKHSEADARYVKLSDAVVRGKGSVFTASVAPSQGQTIQLLEVPGMFTVDATGPVVTITNKSSDPLQHTSCQPPQGSSASAGILEPGENVVCDGTSGAAQTLQLIGGGATPTVSTLTFSAVPTASGGTQDTVQILVGL